MFPTSSVEKLIGVCDQVTANFTELQREWKLLQQTVQQSVSVKKQMHGQSDGVTVARETVQRLKAVTTNLQHVLPAVLRSGLTAAKTVVSLQHDVGMSQKKTAELAAECLQWKNKFAAMSSDCQKEKQEVSELQKEVAQLWDQLNQQSEFGSSLGAATATLLWRVSRNQDSIAALLGGSQVEEFLSLTCSTINSYVEAYHNDWPCPDTDESRFILALCGTITNVAASSYGRDYLMGSENGKRLVDAFLAFLSQAPLHKSARIKSLMLMGMYNISINQKGVQYLTNKPGTLSLMAWHLKEETNGENRVNTLRLLQSIVAECDTSTPAQFLQPIPRDVLKTLSSDRNKQIADLAFDLISDLGAISVEH